MTKSNIVPMSYDITIIGAGPVGCLLASLLGPSKKSILIIDSNDGILEIPRAIALDQDALRILQAARVLDLMGDKIQPINKVQMISPILGTFIDVTAFGDIDCHPRLSSFYQPELERAIRTKMKEFPNIYLVSETLYTSHKEQNDGKILIELNNKGKSLSIYSQMLVGCDGSKSKVRENLMIPMEGSSYEEEWYILDTEDKKEPDRNVVFHCDPSLPIAEIPGPGTTHRWEFLLSRDTNKERIEKELLNKWMKQFNGLDDRKVIRKAIYKFQAKLCPSFSRGKVFLAGDSCHLTPPFAGQGLVSGIRDAYNLFWKLDFYLSHSRIKESLLDSYSIERVPHVRNMIRLARFMGSIIMTKNYMLAFLRDLLFLIIRITPFRYYTTEMKIKPIHKYKEGLFLRKNQKVLPEIQSGRVFPQSIVKTTTGEFKASDDCMGSHFFVLVLGTDLDWIRDTSEWALWKEIGGQFGIIKHTGQSLDTKGADLVMEDTQSIFLKAFGKNISGVIIRPDKIVAAVFDLSIGRQSLRFFLNQFIIYGEQDD